MKILFADLETRAAPAQRAAIARTGHILLAAHGGAAAIHAATTNDFDAVIATCDRLDAAREQMVHRLKSASASTPLVVTAGAAESRVVARLIAGGIDDVVLFASGTEVLVAHVVALVRRVHGHLQSKIIIGALEVDLGTAKCRLAGREVRLTPMEFRLVAALALRRDRPVTRSRLLEMLYGNDSEPFAKSIDRFVHDIRNKFCGMAPEPYLRTGRRAFMLSSPLPDAPGLVGNAG